jgi:hypothetical protein
VKRWERVRFLLRSLSAIAGVVAACLAMGKQMELAGIAGLVSSHAFAIALTIPRDRWSEDERRARRRIPTPLEGRDV